LYNFIVIADDDVGKSGMSSTSSKFNQPLSVSVDRTDDDEEFVLSKNGDLPIISLADVKRGVTAHRDTENNVCFVGPIQDVSNKWDSKLPLDDIDDTDNETLTIIVKFPVVVAYIDDEEISPEVLRFSTGKRIAEFCSGVPAFWLIETSANIPVVVDKINLTALNEESSIEGANKEDSLENFVRGSMPFGMGSLEEDNYPELSSHEVGITDHGRDRSEEEDLAQITINMMKDMMNSLANGTAEDSEAEIIYGEDNLSKESPTQVSKIESAEKSTKTEKRKLIGADGDRKRRELRSDFSTRFCGCLVGSSNSVCCELQAINYKK